MKINKLRSIFYPDFAVSVDWEAIEEAAWLISGGLVIYKKIDLCDLNIMYDLVSQIETNRYKLVEESGDGIRHQALKKIGSLYLQDNYGVGSRDILYESSFLGFEVDVIDRSHLYPVECGNTNPQKLESYLRNERVKSFTLIPYPTHRKVSGFIFSASSEFRRYQEFKDDFRKKKVRQVMDKLTKNKSLS